MKSRTCRLSRESKTRSDGTTGLHLPVGRPGAQAARESRPLCSYRPAVEIRSLRICHGVFALPFHATVTECDTKGLISTRVCHNLVTVDICRTETLRQRSSGRKTVSQIIYRRSNAVWAAQLSESACGIGKPPPKSLCNFENGVDIHPATRPYQGLGGHPLRFGRAGSA